MVSIFLVTENYDRLEQFYLNTLAFDEHEGLICIPNHDKDIVNIRLLEANKNERINPAYFEYSIGNNFLSYCNRLVKLGVRFEVAGMLPNGYAGRFFDPDGNVIQVVCEATDVAEDVDTNGWGFYQGSIK